MTVSFLYFLVSFWCRAQLGADRLPRNAEQARTLTYAASISQRTFSHSLKKTCLNRFAVPSCSGMVSLPHSATHPEEPSLNSSFLESFISRTYIFLDVRNINDWRIYSSCQTHLTFSCIHLSVTTSCNQHFLKTRHLFSPWMCKWKCFWWETQKY